MTDQLDGEHQWCQEPPPPDARGIGHVGDVPETMRPEPMVVVIEKNKAAASGGCIPIVRWGRKAGHQPQEVGEEYEEGQRADDGKVARGLFANDLLALVVERLEDELEEVA